MKKGFSESAARARLELDAIDRLLLDELSRDGRMTNNALAAAAGIAPSTCLGRVRALMDRGVIRGIHADIDPAALGRDLQAMIAVRLGPGGSAEEFGDRMAGLPEVENVYFLAGAQDYLIHVATTDSAALREFVLGNLRADPAVASTETVLIFDHLHPGRRTG